MRHTTYHTLATWSTTPARRQGGRRVRLIKKDQLTMIEGREFLTPDGPRGSILFAGNQRLFFRVRPRRCSQRPIVGTLTAACGQSWQ